MDWGKAVLIFYIAIFLVFFIMRDEDQEDFIYTASIPIGLPIVAYQGLDIQANYLDVIGVTIMIKDKIDTYTYKYNNSYFSVNNSDKRITNPRVETDDKVVLLKMIPSSQSKSGSLYLSSTDRRYIKNQQAYLVYNQNGIEHKIPLRKVRIKPISK